MENENIMPPEVLRRKKRNKQIRDSIGWTIILICCLVVVAANS